LAERFCFKITKIYCVGGGLTPSGVGGVGGAGGVGTVSIGPPTGAGVGAVTVLRCLKYHQASPAKTIKTTITTTTVVEFFPSIIS